MPSFVEIGRPVPEKIFEGFFFTIYWHGSRLGHVTWIIYILKGKSLVSNFDQPDYCNGQSLAALDVPLYGICKVSLFLFLKRNSTSCHFRQLLAFFVKHHFCNYSINDKIGVLIN